MTEKSPRPSLQLGVFAALDSTSVAGGRRRTGRRRDRRTGHCWRRWPTATSDGNPWTYNNSTGGRVLHQRADDRVDRRSTRCADRQNWPQTLRSTSGFCVPAPAASAPRGHRSDRHRARRRSQPHPRDRITGDPATPYEWSVEMAELLLSGEVYTVQAGGSRRFLGAPRRHRGDRLPRRPRPPDQGSSCAADVPRGRVCSSGSGRARRGDCVLRCLRSNGHDLPDITVGICWPTRTANSSSTCSIRQTRPSASCAGLPGPHPRFLTVPLPLRPQAVHRFWALSPGRRLEPTATGPQFTSNRD